METTLLITLAAPFVAAILAPLAYRRWDHRAIWFPLLGALVPLIGLFKIAARVAGEGSPFWASWPWVETIRLRLSFQLDGFGMLFGLLVAGMGVLIVWYAHSYMAHEKEKGRFFGTLLFFLGSMLGAVLADHFFATFLFWEGTSISSFLLIGHWHDREKSRAGALKALVITVVGGLFMMAGLALLGVKTGVWNWSEIGALAATGVPAEPWFTASFLLILLGVFTKSAQVPFHIWLPDAMEAPTPVSAYLHCATMVKLGVYLLFRLFPLYSSHALWIPLLTTVGMATFLVGSLLALKHTDLKAILAYTTIAQLGLFVVMHGCSAADSAIRAALIFHILVHAFYKGALFMLTGIVDHETGTRNIRSLGRLASAMPKTAVFFLLASGSLAGLPGFLGFISKESALEATLHLSHLHHGWAALLPAVLAAGALMTVAVAGKISLGVFFAPAQDPAYLEKHHAHEASWNFLLPPALLAAAGLLFGVMPDLFGRLLFPFGLIGLPAQETPHFKIWHGFTPALALSATAIVGGAVLYAFRRPVQRVHERLKLSWNLNTVYDRAWELTMTGAERLTLLIQNGSLTRYMIVIIGFAGLLIGGTFLAKPDWSGVSFAAPFRWSSEIYVCLGIVFATALVVFLKDRIARIVSLGSVGFLVCVYFIVRGAPDLALTGFLIEIAMFIMILLILKQLGDETPAKERPLTPVLRVAVAVLGGLVMGVVTWTAVSLPLAPSIADYFIRNSADLAGGWNAVNVIVVDFRGFDTMGEITVLVLAGLGVFSLRRVWSPPQKPVSPPSAGEGKSLPPSHILTVVSGISFPIIAVFALYMTLRGHNYPGGGFIGGLIMAGGFVLEMLAVGRTRFLKQFPIHPRVLFLMGLAVAFLTGLVPVFLGYPFLTSAVIYSIHFSTASIFDLGVFFAVVGVTMDIIMLLEEAERKGAPA